MRNTKEVSLSEDGTVLYEYAKQMVELERKIEYAFLHEEKDAPQCITIAASTIPAQYLLPRILARFSERYPKEQFKVMETDSARAIEHVINHTADLSLIHI